MSDNFKASFSAPCLKHLCPLLIQLLAQSLSLHYSWFSANCHFSQQTLQSIIRSTNKISNNLSLLPVSRLVTNTCSQSVHRPTLYILSTIPLIFLSLAPAFMSITLLRHCFLCLAILSFWFWLQFLRLLGFVQVMSVRWSSNQQAYCLQVLPHPFVLFTFNKAWTAFTFLCLQAIIEDFAIWMDAAITAQGRIVGELQKSHHLPWLHMHPVVFSENWKGLEGGPQTCRTIRLITEGNH